MFSLNTEWICRSTFSTPPVYIRFYRLQRQVIAFCFKLYSLKSCLSGSVKSIEVTCYSHFPRFTVLSDNLSGWWKEAFLGDISRQPCRLTLQSNTKSPEMASLEISSALFLVGDAVITMNKAGMWTDGRYFLQAEMQMDDNWTLMKMGWIFLTSRYIFFFLLNNQ